MDQAVEVARKKYAVAYEWIATTQATSLAGVAVKVRRLAEALVVTNKWDDTVARTLLEDIDRLARRAGS